jgi:molybdenum cofactor synthesis domain-containing protein
MSALNKMLREVKVQDAIGMVLAHDLTQIIPGQFKDRLFKKGHVVREEDIPNLLNIGKEHIYILELEEGYLHEDDAALRMAQALGGDRLEITEPKEGKVSVKSKIQGLAKIDQAFIDQVNAIGEIAMATIRGNTLVQAGQALAATRTIPLIVEEQKIVQMEQLVVQFMNSSSGTSPISVKPLRSLSVGLITTGGEVFSGRIQDKFGPVVKQKIADLGSEVVEQRLTPDDLDAIINHIQYFQAQQVDLILVTGGMSVDPDDRTPGAIAQAGAEIISYGTPMLPGSMLMMAYLGEIPIMGLPGCVMHDPYTSFDVLLPRICAGERIERADITAMGYGGLHNC